MAFVNYESKKGSGKKLKVHFDLPEDDDYPNHKRSGSSVSSRSSLDSDEGIENADSKYGLYGSPVWSFQGGSVTQSPPLQHMNSPGYDPNRIPSSIFNKPTSPMEWSVASNESLFSIHIGNNSFSRDQAFAINNKSGELPRTSDFTTLPTVQEVSGKDKIVEMERHSSSSDSSRETSDSVKGQDHEKKSNETAGLVVEVVVDHKKTETSEKVGTDETVLDKTPDDHSKEAKIPNGEPKIPTYGSVESNLSTRSFQFPILTAEGGRISSSTVESEKQEKSENQEQQPEKELQQTPSSKSEKAPKQSGKIWCFCFSCSPCF